MGKSAHSESDSKEDEESKASSSESSEDESKGSNTSDDEEKPRKSEGVKKKKIKKEKKGKKDKKKSHKKSSKDDKKKKKKHKKKHKKSKAEKHYGEFGIITMADLNPKREEFVAWLLEVKNINVETISHVQEKKLFEEYIEDYNTATFPSKKYYDLHAWEMKQKKKQLKGESSKKNDKEITDFNDETTRRKEITDFKKDYEAQKITNALYALHNFSGMHEDMAEQQKLKNLMSHYYKVGNLKEAQRLKKLLEPEKKPNESK